MIQLARLEGFEPTTLGSEDRCSCPLSYRRTAYRILVPESSRVNHRFHVGHSSSRQSWRTQPCLHLEYSHRSDLSVPKLAIRFLTVDDVITIWNFRVSVARGTFSFSPFAHIIAMDGLSYLLCLVSIGGSQRQYDRTSAAVGGGMWKVQNRSQPPTSH